MATKKKLLQAAAGQAAGGAALNVEDVFSTYLYEGNGGSQVIDNGINLGQSNSGGGVDFSSYDTINMSVPGDSDFGFGTGDYTIEFFVYKYKDKNYTTYYDQRTASQSAASNTPFLYSDSGGTLYFHFANANRISGTGTSLAAGAWSHVALCRSSGSTKLFVNGTQIGSTYSDNNNYVTPASNWSIGGSLEQSLYNVEAVMSNVRVVKGSALYTSNFTAPTSALTAVSGTVLLALQGDDPFVDNSSSGHSLTNNGAKAVSFGPFDADDAGEGGLVWIKKRSSTSSDHCLTDTERGATKFLVANETDVEDTNSSTLASFNSSGFSIGDNSKVNSYTLTDDFASWTFRKAPKFFDVVTYIGNRVDTNSFQDITHNLGSTPGMIIVKETSSADDWMVYHRSVSVDGTVFKLNTTDAATNFGNVIFDVSEINDSTFRVGNMNNVNANGSTYVAYLFAHNDGDGEFGGEADADIIKCGSYTGNGSTDGPEIDLGFEPQFVILKRSSGTEDWLMFDNMRGMVVGGIDSDLRPAQSQVEGAFLNYLEPNATGFKLIDPNNRSNASGETYIYMAIRRGTKVPESATEVFKTVVPTANRSDSPEPYWSSGFTVDMAIHRANAGSTEDTIILSRVAGENVGLDTNTTDAEDSASFKANMLLDYNTGVHSTTGYGAAAGSEDILHMWRRAPGYFDVVAYSGNSTAGRTVSHNLTVAPEMMWVKNRSSSSNWQVYHKNLNGGTNPANYWLKLNDTTAEAALSNKWNDTEPTQSVFSVGNSSTCNASGNDYIAYLFASLPGISKVGSFTGNGGSQTIDCGFTSGARFVLIKRVSATSNWLVFDTERGIVSGNDPYLFLDTSDAEDAYGSFDEIDPHPSGFTFNYNPAGFALNGSGSELIFYAIA